VPEVRGGRRRVLFVCEHDAGASRMCAAYLRHLAADRYEPLSAALEPATGVRLEAAAALSEDGVAVVDGAGTELTPELAAEVDRIITLGFTLNPEVARDVPREEWGIPEPAGRPMQEVRVIRDTIHRLVDRLVARLDTEAAVR
jgi:protein-tyrosine-phosphatase